MTVRSTTMIHFGAEDVHDDMIESSDVGFFGVLQVGEHSLFPDDQAAADELAEATKELARRMREGE